MRETRSLVVALAGLFVLRCAPPSATAPPDDGALDATDASPTLDANATDAADTPDASDAPRDVRVTPVIERTQPDETRARERGACSFGPGAWPAETFGNDVPLGRDIPVDHVLVLMQENRSFDHYFGHLGDAFETEAEGPPSGWMNRDSSGAPVAPQRDTELCVRDPAHGWDPSHAQWNAGANDGFVTNNEPDGARVMRFLTRDDVPFYYALAQNFAIGDRYFASVMGPTWPNRYFLMAGTSFGLTRNTLLNADTRETPASHVFQQLDAFGVTWKDYAIGGRMLAFFPYYGVFRRETRAHYATHEDLLTDLRRGELPAVGFIEPNFLGTIATKTDEHPPAVPQVGQAFVETVVRALMASPAWGRTVLFITYDEHGGFADHVPPPSACEPDEHRPEGPHRFDRYGFRVPFIAVSPYARRGFVSHRVYDHTSILRFIEARFGLPALTRRDANAAIPTDLFDFANAPHRTPPALAAGRVDPAVITRCTQAFPEVGSL